MSTFKFALLGLLHFLSSLALGSECPENAISKLVVCYYEGKTSLNDFDLCNCTHIVLTKGVTTVGVNNISITEDANNSLEIIKEKNENLTTIFTLTTNGEETSRILKSENRSEELVKAISGFLQESKFDGIEIDFRFRSDDGVSKESFTYFIKSLSKTLSSHRRIKREGYDVFEKLDDITTASYTTQTPKNSTSKAQSIKQRNRNRKQDNSPGRKIREESEEEPEDEDYLTLEDAVSLDFPDETSEKQNTLKDVEEDVIEEKKPLLFVRLPLKPEIIAKKFDLKALSRYSDFLIVPTHNITSKEEEHVTYHPSRLMGLADMLNTDSILDLLTGLGGLKSKMVITLPATVLKFELKDKNKNTPRAPSGSKPQIIDQSQLCSILSKNNWTIERDDDLTAPYAYSEKKWLAFEDEISINIKGKYILLRELAGGAIYPIDADVSNSLCTNRTGSNGYLTGILHRNFEKLERKPRALVLESLQEQIHDTTFNSIEAGVKLSEYRIVRVVDHTGAVHVIRKNTKTQFECSRQGYFSHPLGCNKFYRCVKFDQYSDEFTVFEYDCPAGLAFDERWEVCVWPGSLPHGAPCTGSSEIAPVPRSHYRCPNVEGYYADPENCRWFFACLDHARDGVTPLTAYEFRCPFGLVFSQEKLACDWPWLVGSCGNVGAAGYLQFQASGLSQGIHSATFINGGDLAASLGQYGNTEQEDSFRTFGSKFGKALKGAEFNSQSAYQGAQSAYQGAQSAYQGAQSAYQGAQSAYQGAQSAGFGYIASQYNDNNHNRASFASFPDFEISGGRIFNKGGVVLDQNIVGISSGGAANTVELNTVGSVQGGARGSGYFNQESVQTVNEFNGGAGAAVEQLNPSLGIIKTNLEVTGHSSQVQHPNLVSTPKPFSVSIPSVQINSEYLEHSTASPTTPQSVLFPTTTPKTNIISINQQQQHTTSHGFTATQPTVSVNVPAVTPATVLQTFEGISSGSSHLKTPLSISSSSTSFSAKPKTEIHRFSHSDLRQNEFLTVGHPAVATGAAVTTGAHSFGYDLGRGSVSTPVSVSVPVVTSKPEVQNFQYSSVGQSTSFFQPTVTPFTASVQENHGIGEQSSIVVGGIGKTTVSNNIPAIQIHNFESSGGEKTLVSGSFGQSGATYEAPVATVTPLPFVPSGGKTGIATGLHLSTVSSIPTLSRSQQSSIDSKISEELYLNTPKSTFSVSSVTPKIQLLTQTVSGQVNANGNVYSNKIPIVTPKTEYQFSQTGQSTFDASSKGKSSLSYSFPTVTFQPELKLQEVGSNGVGVTPVAPISLSGFEAESGNTFVQTGNAGKVSFNVPQTEIHSFGQPAGISQVGKVSYGVPALTSSVKTEGVVQIEKFPSGFLRPRGFQPSQQSTFDQKYSLAHSSNNFGSFGSVSSTPSPVVVKTTGSLLPTIQKTEVSVEQQPIVSVGTVSSIGQTGYAPQSLQSKSAVSRVDFKSNYNQQTFVTTPAPAVSIVPFSSVTSEPPQYTSNVFTKSSQITAFQQQPKNIRVETSGPVFVNVPDVTFEEKSSNLEQEFNSFTPSVTTSVPLTYKKEFTSGTKSEFLDTSRAYLPPVTPKVEVFGASVSHTPAKLSTFEKTVQGPSTPVVHHTFNFFGSNPSTEQNQINFIPQVTTAAPEYEKRLKIDVPVVTTSKPFVPQEKLVDVEITKSVEINPSEFFQSSGGFLSQNTLGKSIEIQQQPLHLLSQKTLPAKQVIQPFYEQQAKDVSDYRNQEQFAFHQIVNVKSPKTEFVEQKQYLPPEVTVTTKPALSTLTYSTAKSVSFNQPSLYSEDNTIPALPVFEASKVPITSPKVSNTAAQYLPPSSSSVVKSSIDTSFVQQYQGVTPKINVLLPTTTQSPVFVSPQTDAGLSFHGSYNFQKINTNTPEVQNVFSLSENPINVKSTLNEFNSNIQSLKTGVEDSVVQFGNKYVINPKIAIPDPPKEYILAQNSYTTVAPEFSTVSTTQRQFQSSVDSTQSGFKGSTYLPPIVASRKKPSKATLISVGTVPDTENDHELFAKYSGEFGQVIRGRNGKFVSKLVKGNGKGEIEINRQGSSTVQYEISSTTPRANSRGRQYHGGITSGIQATNKYEEYDISEDSSRSFNGESDSKTTLDLKNLKLEKNKKTVIVVSQVSDANPLLVGKLAGQCSCQSNMLELRSKGSSRRKNKNSSQRMNISNKFLPPFETNEASGTVETYRQGEASTVAPDTVVIDGTKSSRLGLSVTTEQNYISSSTTASPELVSSTILSSLGPNGVLSITPKTVYVEDKQKTRKKQFRGRARYLPPSVSPDDGSSGLLSSAVPASEIASTFDYSILTGDESRTQNEINGGIGAGAAFDRYGPGGWRGFDEVLQGSVDCKRPGLFRHPKYCNKFYACNYDPWKERYTLHVFNCPIHLTYDSSISACNWPVRGPACADDNLLV